MVEPGVQIVCAQGSARRPLPLGEPLRRAGFSVCDAVTAEELFQRVASGPDLLVLENSLPDQSADEVLRALRMSSTTVSVPVLLVDRPIGSRSPNQEADGYLAGDPEPAEVLAWTRALLRRRDTLRLETLGRLASGLAHDFNNLLTVLGVHVELLGAHLPQNDPGQELLGGLKGATEAAAQMASHLLALVRRQDETPQLVDVNVVLREVLTLLRRALPVRISLTLDADPRPLLVRAVPCLLVQILLNLCLNARDAMPQGGRLILTTNVVHDQQETLVHLGVCDTGEGIAPEVMPHIFEPLFTTRLGRGTGLGLSTVHMLVRQLGGAIECSSAVGRGSCFDVYLPAAGE